jgi:hypothetical protein
VLANCGLSLITRSNHIRSQVLWKVHEVKPYGSSLVPSAVPSHYYVICRTSWSLGEPTKVHVRYTFTSIISVLCGWVPTVSILKNILRHYRPTDLDWIRLIGSKTWYHYGYADWIILKRNEGTNVMTFHYTSSSFPPLAVLETNIFFSTFSASIRTHKYTPWRPIRG